MSMRAIAVVLVLGVGVLAYVSWMRYQAAPPDAAAQAEVPSDEGAAPPGMAGGTDIPATETPDPGLTWSPASRWQQRPDRAMRLATYSVPRSADDSEDAECALFYFGPGQGGSVEANIERWIGEFENAMPGPQSSTEVAGMRVSRVEVSGNYLAHTGPKMEATGKKSNWKLLGAIVESPGGPVFFKLTGPTRTVDAARKEFDGMIAGMRRK